MRFAYKNWKKVKHEKDYTVMQNDRGDELKISHAKLSPKLRGELAALPVHMADGGVVSQKPKEAPVQINIGTQPQAPSALVNPNAGQGSGVSFGAPQEAPAAPAVNPGDLPYGVTPEAMAAMQASGGALQPSLAQAAGIPQPAGTMQEAASPDAAALAASAPAAPTPQAAPPMAAAPAGFERTNMGLAQEAKIADQVGKEQAAALQKQEDALSRLNTAWQDNMRQMQETADAFKKSLDEGEINPNKFWESQSTPSKILTAIGLVMGGIGGGMTRTGRNPAAEMLQKQIDNDIEAQKANLGRKQTLLKMNMDHYGNMRDAMTATRLMLNEAADIEIRKAAAKAKGPEAQARLMQLLGEREGQNAAAAQRMAILRAVDQVSQGGSPDDAPKVVSALRQAGMTKEAEDLQSRWVPGMGVVADPKDAPVLKEKKAAVDSINSGLQQLNAIGRRSGKSLSPSDRAEAQVIAGQLKGPMRTALGLGTLSESDKEFLDNIVADPTNLLSLDSSNKVKLQTLMNRMQDGLNKEAAARGIKVKTVQFRPAQ